MRRRNTIDTNVNGIDEEEMHLQEKMLSRLNAVLESSFVDLKANRENDAGAGNETKKFDNQYSQTPWRSLDSEESYSDLPAEGKARKGADK
jgi:hypothetical protein